MSGNPDKASLWADADVLIGAIDSPLPGSVDIPFDGTWDFVGLLDGDAGFEESRAQDSSDFFAWGGLLIKTARRNFKLTRKFVAFEENAVTLGLVWPGSGPGERVVPKRHKFKAGFETVEGDKTKRVVTRNYAEVSEVGTIKDSESELTKLEITIDIYPDSDGVLFDVQPDEASVSISSIAITPLTLALDVGDFLPLVVTATYSDASTVDVSSAAVLTSSAAGKAAVQRGGYIKGVSNGTANIEATFKGLVAPAPCVVSVS